MWVGGSVRANDTHLVGNAAQQQQRRRRMEIVLTNRPREGEGELSCNVDYVRGE